MATMQPEPFLVRHGEAQRLLGVGTSYYFQLVREGRIKTVGEGRMSRAIYSSVKEYVRGLVAEAEAKAGELV
jgi:hypothetical protein